MSTFFYFWGEGWMIGVMAFSIAANFVFARLLEKKPQKSLMAAVIVVNLAILFTFKYLNFFLENLSYFFSSLGSNVGPWKIDVVLPIGVSFFTFQAISYVVDVYRREIPAERRFSYLFLFISFFAHLIAGPIVRYRDIRDQMNNRSLSLDGVALGLSRFVMGLGKKILIADTVGQIADRIFALPVSEYNFAICWFGVFCYALQIYFDFSGYSDMAIGLAKIFGFKFLENFNYPYISTSITEFWRRWHISLSTWFRDYLYIPLGGNRHGALATYRNLLIVFLLCGLWHGASWNFICWGLFHGIFLCIERSRLKAYIPAGSMVLGRFYTLSVVLFSWVLFRADSLSQAGFFMGTMLWPEISPTSYYDLGFYLSYEKLAALLVAILFSMPTLAFMSKIFRESFSLNLMRTVALGLVLFLSCLKLSSVSYNPFIYFRF